MRSLAIAFTLVLALVGCPLRDPVPVEPDYPPPTPFLGNVEESCASACANLRRLGCPEGQGAVSGETCERRCVVAMSLRPMPLVCWIKAEDVVTAKACGGLRCVK